jgi:hypothetical protein
MSSVRQRIEREQREAAEKLASTSTRRVALGASGPTISTRQRADLADAQHEVLEPSPHTRTGGTDFMGGGFSRVRDRQSATADAIEAARPRPRTQAEIDADEYLALETRRRAEAGVPTTETASRRSLSILTVKS